MYIGVSVRFSTRIVASPGYSIIIILFFLGAEQNVANWLWKCFSKKTLI